MKRLKKVIPIAILALVVFSLLYTKNNWGKSNKPIIKKSHKQAESPYNDKLDGKSSFYDDYTVDDDSSEYDEEEPADYDFETDEEADDTANVKEDYKEDGQTDDTVSYNDINIDNFEFLALDFVTNMLTDEEQSLVSEDLKKKYNDELSKIQPYTELNGVDSFDDFTADYGNRFLEIMTQDGKDYRFEFGIMDGKLASCKQVVD